MLRTKIGESTLVTHGYIVAVEMEDTVDPHSLMEKLQGSLTFVECVGRVDIEHLGELELVDDTLEVGTEVDVKDMN